jgi:hypothetical protein
MRSRLIVLVFVSLVGATVSVFGQTSPPPNLGFASSFAVLGGSVANSGSTTVIAGNVGTSPGNRLNGSGVKFILGDPRLNDSLAQQAQKDRAAAYDNLATRSVDETLVGDLGLLGRPLGLGPGVYRAPADAVLTGSLVLNAGFDPNAVWIFEIDSSLTTKAGSTVQTINEGRDNNVFWRIGGPATFGTKSVFAGNVLAKGNIAVESNATISGRLLTPAAVSLTDAGVTICCAVLDMAPHVLPDGMAGADYIQTLTPKAGKAPYKFALAASDPGASVTVTEGGLLSVKSPPAGVFKLAVTISDSTGISCVRVYRLVICGGITLSPLDPLKTCIPNKCITAGGGTEPYTYTVTAGKLPDGLSLVQCPLSGTPTTPGPYDFTITATDVFGCTGSRRYMGDITGGLVLTPDTLPEGTVGVEYPATITASGGAEPYKFVVSGPSWLISHFNGASVTFTGKPDSGGCYTVTVTVSTAACSVSKTYEIVIRPVPVTFSPDPLPSGTVCTPYCETISVDGCLEPYTFDDIPAASLPPGLTFDKETKKLCGTPAKPGNYIVKVVVRDVEGHPESHDYSLEIVCPTVPIDRDLPPATACVYYEHQLPNPDCDGPYVYSPVPGPIPDGLKLSPHGLLYDVPTTPGDYTFNVTVKPKECPAVIVPVHLIVLCNVTITPPQLPNGRLGVPYTQTLTASCGTPPYTFSIVSGPPPTGLTPFPNGTGTLSGTPTALGCFTFRVRVTDAGSPACTAEQTYRVCIIAPPTEAAPALSGWGIGVMTTLLILSALLILRRLNG